jgi:diguanylate cyclase (GGDEF)-like protein/PAS domain S-box-containing protein
VAKGTVTSIAETESRQEERRPVASRLELQAIFDNATVGILFTSNRLMQRCNALCAEMFGYAMSEFIGLPGRAIYPSDAAYEDIGSVVGPILARGDSYRGEFEMRRRDGSLFWCKVSAKAVDPDNPNEGTIWIMEDVTRDRTLREALRQSTSELVSIFETALIGIAVVRHGRIARCNNRFDEILGYAPGDIFGQPVRLLYLSEQEFIQVRAEFSEHLVTGEAWRIEQRLQRRTGESFWARISGRVFDAQDVHAGSVWLLEDITEQKLASERIQQALDEQSMIFDNAAVGIMFLRSRQVLRCNRRLAEIFGYAEEDLVGQSTRILYFSEEDFHMHAQRFAQALEEADIYIGESSMRHADGHLIWVRATGRIVDDGSVVWIIEDVTERHRAQMALAQAHETLEQRVVERTTELAEANRQLQDEVFERARAEQRIWHVAHHDALTGLPNRALLHDRLEQALTQAVRNEHRVAVMFIDLDRFKSINDSLGHDVGDDLLKSVAARLSGVVRAVDTVSRLGGDEFVIVLPDVSESGDAARVADKMLAVLASPVVIHGHELRATPSIGISLFPDDGTDAYTLMKNADTAMYHAKSEGRNNFQFFNTHMNERALRFFTLEQRMRTALEETQFVLYYQPIVEHRTGAVRGFEALVRWRDPEVGLVSPAEFIPVAEESGLIIPLGEWVLAEAMRQNREWQQAGLPFMPIAVNLSPRQFRHRGLVDSVRSVLRESGQPAHLLEIEITESALMHDVDEASEKLRELEAMGVRIAIDDFGTGYSSLSLLRRFPVHKLKIDRSFVDDVCTSKEDESIVVAILGLSRSLGLECVAEGVETVAQLTRLAQHQCDMCQGYLFSPPVSAEKVPALLATNFAQLASQLPA